MTNSAHTPDGAPVKSIPSDSDFTPSIGRSSLADHCRIILCVLKDLLALLGTIKLLTDAIGSAIPEHYGILQLKLSLAVLAIYVAWPVWRETRNSLATIFVSGLALLAVIVFHARVPTFPEEFTSWKPSVADRHMVDQQQIRTSGDAIRHGLIFEADQRYDEALGDFKKAIDDRWTKPFAELQIANIYRIRRDFQASEQFYHDAIRHSGNLNSSKDRNYLLTHAWNDLGIVLRAQARLAKTDKEKDDLTILALNAFTTATDLDPTFPKAWYNRGQVFFDRREFDSAYESYRSALYRDPEYGKAAYNLASLAAVRKKSDESCKWLQRACQIDASWGYRVALDPDFDNVRRDQCTTTVIAAALQELQAR